VKYLKEATPVQRFMAILMGIALAALLIWSIPELIGAFSAASEDTWSEWVWDQDLWVVLTIAGVSVLAGGLLIWSAGHFLEGYKRRRDRESQDD
jgi:hypothetical protein